MYERVEQQPSFGGLGRHGGGVVVHRLRTEEVRKRLYSEQSPILAHRTLCYSFYNKTLKYSAKNILNR